MRQAMLSLRALFASVLLLVAACGAEPPRDPAPTPATTGAPEPEQSKNTPAKITREAVDQVAHLLAITANGRLTPLVREAERTENFQSNFGGQSHSRHWFLLRRVGVDPVEKLHMILSEPFGTKKVGSETWFIWPDFAALSPDELIPERLDFQNRARLREMIGEEGIARIRSGEPYPGVRTAISDSGRWVYFIHDIDTSEDPE